MSYVDIVFDGPPGHESGRFVEVENAAGRGINLGTWIERGDGLWALRIQQGAEVAAGEQGFALQSAKEHLPSSPPPPSLEGVEEELRAALAKAIPTRGDTIELQMSEGAALLSALAGMREEKERMRAEVIEECAKVVEAQVDKYERDGWTHAALESAAFHIRALAEGSASKNARESTERGEADT